MPISHTNDPAVQSFGTQIQVLSNPSPEAFTTIAGVGDIDGPTRSIAETETTSHSTGIPVRTYKPSLIDPGTLSFPCFFNPSDPTHSADSDYGLEHLFEGRVTTKFRLINTDDAQRTREFMGFVRELGETYPVEGVCTRDTTIRISGLMIDVVPTVTVTPASASPTAAGGAASFTVTVTGSSGGAWFPSTTSSWISITSPTTAQTASGSVSYTVAAQEAGAPSRTGKIRLAGQDFTITQAAGA